MKEVYLYTDGAARGNPGPGGYGLILELPGSTYKKEHAEGFVYTTNNRMELLAVIVGLELLKEAPIKVTVFTDSKYVCDAVEKKWIFRWEKEGFKKQKNQDLWKRFLILFRKHSVVIKWIKGHNQHPQNERCDALAVAASKQKNQKETIFKEHVWINPFWEDDPYEVADLMGPDRVVFGSDWPHIEGMPAPLDYVMELKEFSMVDQKKILLDNVTELNEPKPLR